MSSKNDSRPLFLWGPVVVYMAAIFYVSSLSDPPIPSGTDLQLHSIVYLGLAVLIVRALAGGLRRRVTLATAVGGVLLTVLYGATDEIHQMYVPGRYAAWADLAADAAGALAGTIVCWAWGILSQASRDES